MPEPHDSLLTLVADALAERKAEHPRVLDVRRLTDITDFMVVASGRSRRQVAAIGEHVIERAKQAGHRPLGIEGLDGGEWVLVDLCDVVVHVMQPEIRDLYQLEKLWDAADTSGQGGHGAT